jgi:iron complex outermembrane receptor protein
VPGVQVAQIDANKWAVSARGFNGRFAARLLVLMDGRSVYSPLYSGVYWESQDTFIEDIERIEVIRGPGATLWGANAVNGVVNIITKGAADTTGSRVYAGIGDELAAFGGARHGFRVDDDTAARVYAKYKKHDSFELVGGDDARDDWDNLQAGFRVDHTPNARDTLTVQGDVYTQDLSKYVERPTLTPPYTNRFLDSADASGANLVGRWTRALSDGGDIQVQVYVDRYDRTDQYADQKVTTYDVDFQHRFTPRERHEIVWGLGYRFTDQWVKGLGNALVTDEDHENHLFSAFVQDEITLVPGRWTVVLGSKFEHNDFTGFEAQPSARVVFKPEQRQTLWAAVSRAVRTPSVGEQVNIIPFVTIPPNTPPNFPNPLPLQLVNVGDQYDESVEQIAYEFGWRKDVSRTLSLDAALYYTEYDNGRLAVPGASSVVVAPLPYVQQLLQLVNGVNGETYGAELAAAWELSDTTRLQLAYSHQRTFDHSDLVSDADFNEGSQPRNQLSLRVDTMLTPALELNLWGRYVDQLSGVNTASAREVTVPSYTELDLQLTWRPQPRVELSLVGRNLLNPSHQEFVQEAFTPPSEIERSVYGYVKVDF